MHDSRTIANRFLELAEAQGKRLTPMQVLKLVYIAHGWDLALYGNPLIRDRVEAWQYGPVIPRLYNALKKFHASEVEGRLTAEADTPLTNREESLIADVYRIYGGKSGLALSRLTHAEGTPWSQTYEQGSFGIEIPRDFIQEHYQRLAERA